MEPPPGTCGSRTSLLAHLSSTRKVLAHGSCPHLHNVTHSVLRRKQLCCLDFRLVSIMRKQLTWNNPYWSSWSFLKLKYFTYTESRQAQTCKRLQVPHSNIWFNHARSSHPAIKLYFSQIIFDFRSKSLRTPSNAFIINLAFFDLTMALEIPMLIMNSFLQHMIGWETGCNIYAALGSVSGIGSAMTNAAIAYDRYRWAFCCLCSIKWLSGSCSSS